MFSKRLKYPFKTNELFTLLTSIDNSDILNIIESNPTRVGLNYDVKILNSFLKEENLRYEPDPHGLLNARKSILSYYKEKSLKIDENQIFITSGTSEAYSYIFKIICDPFDNILVPVPGYPLFEYLSSLEMVEVRNYRLDYIHNKGWLIDFDSLISSIDEKTKAIILINPNNPTGSYISDSERQILVNIAIDRNIALIADEVFFDFNIGGEKFCSFVEERNVLTFVLSGISKILALPQMKLSWIVVCGEEKIRKEAIERLEVVSDSFLSASIPIQNALEMFFKYGEKLKNSIQERIKENYSLLYEKFKNSPIRLLKADGGWSAILELPKIISEEEWVKRLLLEKKCLTYPGYFFDFEREAFIVLSLIIEKDKILKGVDSIFGLFDKYKI